MVASYRVIGKPTPRADGIEKVTGSALYSADYDLPGTLWGKALHSAYAHARILSIDTSAAKALPGVHAVITGDDCGDLLYGRAIRDLPILAKGRVRFFGERVAAVAADDEDTALQAIDLIEVEYEELPAVYEPSEAIEAGAPILHPGFNSYAGAKPIDAPSNVYSHTTFDRGDLGQGFADADVIVDNTYTTSRVHQAYLEPQGVLINIEGGRVHVWTCSKAPYATLDAFAKTVEIPIEDVVFNHTFIGGDFGGKATPADLPIGYMLAKHTGRPVRMVLDYLEELMAANPRHSTIIRLRTGLKNDGTLTAHHVQFYVNAGAYAGYKPLGTIGGANQAAGVYKVSNVRVESIHVYTNTVPGGHMRSPGEPQGIFAIESHVDEMARRLGMDPVEFRLKNLIADGDESPIGHHLEQLHGVQTMRAAANASGYAGAKAPLVGRGVAIAERGPGGGEGNSAVTLQPDGSVVLGTPIFDQGTGTYTILKQVVAEEMQVSPGRVSVDMWNTDSVKFDSGLGGMRAARVNTIVAYEACLDTKRELFKLAADRLGWPEDALVLRDDEVRRTDTEEAIRWPDLLRDANTSVTGRAHVMEGGRGPITSFAAQVAEVQVDPETGEFKLTRFVTAHDVGRVLNPIGHQGQINGGLMQGLGQAIMEELRVEEGRVTTLSMGDYKIPTIADLPPLETVLVEHDSGLGPYHIKGIGESPIAPVPPAIANAIEDAIGVRIRDLPITSEKVYEALKAKRAGR